MYAIVDINGKQYKVEEGKYIQVDLMDLDQGESVTLDNVLLIVDGDQVQIGKPNISGATVQAKVRDEFKDSKVIVYKMRPKKGYRLTKGHRQPYTRIQIEKINSTVAA